MSRTEMTPERIAQCYSAAMDSVNLINTLLAQPTRTEDEDATVARNKAHLQIIVAKPFWTTEDLTPLTAAIAA